MERKQEIEELSKEEYLSLRKIMKQEFFGFTKPVPFKVPLTRDCESVLAKALGESVKRHVWRVVHIVSGKKWFKVLKVNKKTIVTIEGRKGEKWWTVTFSRTVNKHCKRTILEEVMMKHEQFKKILKSKEYTNDVEVVREVGEYWKKHIENDRKVADFAKEVIEKLEKKNKNRMNARRKWRGEDGKKTSRRSA